ncbi:MAG: hypothetical protein VW516_13515 [Rhodospirillaceae bacterium]
MTREEATAEIRLAARVCRDLFPRGRIGPFLFALAHDVDVGTRTPAEAYDAAAVVIRVAVGSMK